MPCAWEHAMVAMGYSDGGSVTYGGPDYIGKCPHLASLLTLLPSVPEDLWLIQTLIKLSLAP